jgi:ABC-2 type transport system ATP-binding protein
MITHHAIEVEKLTKKFGDFVAVDQISFQVGKGEIFGFLGANGAGKTTAIRMLCGLLKPTAGKAEVAGYNILSHREKVKGSIGYMSQRFSLYDDLTAFENIRFYGGIYGLSLDEIKRKSEMLLKKLGLYESRNKPVRSLPLGWKQKLAFSVASVHDPKIIFLDEPTSGVDPYVRRQFWHMIYESAENGVTIFVTTHYMEEAE